MSTCNGCGPTPMPPICTASVTDVPVFFRVPDEHSPVPGFIRTTVTADCTTTVAHLNASKVAFGTLYPQVEVLFSVDPLAADSAASANDREFVVVTYRANAAGTGYSAGDIITSTRVYDVDGASITVVGTTIWFNDTTGLAIAAPTAAHLDVAGAPGLSDTQLAARMGGTTTAAAGADGTGDYTVIAGIKRALLNWASLLGRIPAALVGGRFSVASSVPHMSTGVIMSAQTNATGTNWTPFSSQACVALDIVNNTAVTIEYRRGAAGTAMQIPAGGARMVIGITNANQIDVRRTDTANTQVTVQAEAFQH